MTFADFCVEALEHIQNGNYGATPLLRLYTKGYRSEDPSVLSFIRSSNIKYFNSDSDELLGNFIEMNLAEEEGKDGRGMVRLDMSYLYDAYTNWGWKHVDDIVQANIDQILSPEYDLLHHLSDYSLIKNHLIIRLLPASTLDLDPKRFVFRMVGDIAMVLYILVSDDTTNLISTRVPRAYVREWGVSEDELFDWALRNSASIAPPRIYLHPDEMEDPPYERGIFLGDGPNRLQRIDPFVRAATTLTTIPQTNGAVAIFYPGVMERIAELYEDRNYYVFFSSIHEAMLHATVQFDVATLRRMLWDNNRVFPDTVLTHHIYLYDRKKKIFYAR